MDSNNDDETNPALTGEGEVNLLDKIYNEMENANSVLNGVITVSRIFGVEDSRVMKMEEAESKLNVAIFILRLLEMQDSNVRKVIILLIILMIPMLLYFI